MKQSRSFKQALGTLLLSIALTVTFEFASWAQAPGLLRIGVLTPGGDFEPVLEGLLQGLVQLGYVEGKQITFVIEDTKMETLDPLKAAMRLLESKPRLLVTVSSGATTTAKQVAGTIPIVFAVISDPVRLGYVSSFVSSKNNLTGVSSSSASLSGKRLEVLKDMVPGIRHVLAVVSVKESIAQISFKYLDEAAKKFGVQLVRRDVTTKEELEKILLNTSKGSVDAIIHVPSTFVRNHIALLIDKAKQDRLPLSVHAEELVKKGALVSYGDDFRLIGVQTARIVVKVLNGTKPSEIPIETPERPVLVFNRTTAKIIGLKMRPKFLERVDRVVD